MASLTTQYSGLQSPRLNESKDDIHPIESSNLFSKACFLWVNKIISLGNKKQLHPNDVWLLQKSNQVNILLENFNKIFEKSNHHVLKTFFLIYGWKLAFLGLLEVFYVACDLYGPVYVLPQITETIQKSIENNSFNWKWSLFLVFSLYFVQIISSFLKAHTAFINSIIGIQFTACLRAKLFQKAMILNLKSKKEKNAGDIANYFSVDIMNISSFSTNLNLMWIVPIQIGVTLYFIERQVGWAIWMGFAALIIIMLITGIVTKFAVQAQYLILKCKDDRMKIVNELFSAIQIVKFNAWEEKLSNKIIEMRETELNAILSFIKSLLLVVTALYTTPVLITVVVFATYVLLMERILDVTVIFTTLALFKMLQESFINLPSIMMLAVQAVVSANRITTMLNMEEINPDNVQTTDTVADKSGMGADKIVVQIQDGSFGWDPENPLFNNINMTIRQGEFVVVHGVVGTGKSSLCSILLGEIEKYNGSVFVGGRIAYFSQQSWILNGSIRENILFAKPYDPIKYRKVIEACALTKDLESFPASDRTEIGLKGINLSGGQKARISLARACYSDADIYILDSPLSAVDAIVSNEIFTKCFLGLLSEKTVLLVTHNPDIIESPSIDRSYLVQDGKLVESTQDKPRVRISPPISPMQARTGYWDNVDDDGEVVAPVRQYDLLVTPSANTPYKFQEAAMLFTPRDATAAMNQPTQTLIVEEERAEGRVSKEVVKLYLSAIGGWSSMFIMILATLLTEGVRIGGDMWLSYWGNIPVDRMKSESKKNMTVYSILIIVLCILTIIQVGVVLMYGLRGSRKLFIGMLQGIIQAPMRYFDTNPIGRILNRFGDDIFQCDIQIPLSFAPVLVETASGLSKIVTSMVVIQWMGLLLPPLMYIYVKLGTYFLAPLREINRIKKVTLSPLLSLVSEGYDGSTTIRAFGDRYLRRFNRLHDIAINDYSAANFAAVSLNQWFSLRVQLISSSIVFAILLGCIIMHKNLSPGLIALVITYGLGIPTNLASLVNMWANLETALISPERVHEYSVIQKEGERETPFELGPWPAQGRIEFIDVSFRYKPEDPLVLKNVSFSVNAGEKIGVVGRTGAGKSSLMMALFRINDVASGSIKIDGIDIATIGLKDLRGNMAIIPQNPVLFKGTLRNYLDPFDEFSDDDLWNSLRKVKMTDRITSSEEKLFQLVEENGENFSVGERQMLCMSRALLRNAKIVVLDEATAAIDHETDQLLQKVVREEFANSTILTIAHRLDTVLDYNRIFVFEKGQLVQCDTPQVLCENDGIFREMITEGGYSDRLNF